MILTISRFVGFVATLFIWRAVRDGAFSVFGSLVLVVMPCALAFPTVWVARKALDVRPTPFRLNWVTSIVHFALMVFYGACFIEAAKLFSVYRGIVLSVPASAALLLVSVSAGCLALTVLNLALRGLGAPFAIALSRRLAADWMYGWTRNPMVLCTLATLISIGIYLQSLFFVAWTLLLVAPSLIYYLKVYEERELELRFGESYIRYRAKTAFLWPRRPLTKSDGTQA